MNFGKSFHGLTSFRVLNMPVGAISKEMVCGERLPAAGPRSRARSGGEVLTSFGLEASLRFESTK